MSVGFCISYPTGDTTLNKVRLFFKQSSFRNTVNQGYVLAIVFNDKSLKWDDFKLTL